MKGSECKFVKYMEGSDKRFVIPVYQRNYDWKMENCKQLFDDLEKIFQYGTPENTEEIFSKMEKLIICMEVEAWEKAESFAHNIKELVEQGPKDIKKSAFRMEMSVRKGKEHGAI